MANTCQFRLFTYSSFIIDREVVSQFRNYKNRDGQFRDRPFGDYGGNFFTVTVNIVTAFRALK